MSAHFQNKQLAITITGSAVAALFVYSVLSYFFIPTQISTTLSIIMGLLVFALTIYYNTVPRNGKETQNLGSNFDNEKQKDIHDAKTTNENPQEINLIFVAVFVILILITSFPYSQDFQIFVNWNQIGVYSMIQLFSAIMLCFFIPGYAIVNILFTSRATDRILVFLLSYLLSMLITGLVAYVYALFFDGNISESRYLFVSLYLAILASYLAHGSRHANSLSISLAVKHYLCYFIKNYLDYGHLKYSGPKLLVFGCLIMLIIISTYIIYGGTTIGDQWYHQGRAFLFMDGSIKEAAISSGDSTYYPPFQSGLLAALTTISGMPLVNSYASIAFVNIIPIIAFYHFFSAWVPENLKKARVLACSLFTLASGFGWIYFLSKYYTDPFLSPELTLEKLTGLRNLDIINTSNFSLATAPDFSTALIYIALPAGLFLLGLLRTLVGMRFRNVFIVTAVSVLGIMSHYEFYLFIIIASILPIVFRMNSKNFLYFSILIAILFVLIIDIIIPGGYYSLITIVGVPLLLLALILIIITWIVYLTRGNLRKVIERIFSFLQPLKNRIYINSGLKLVAASVIIFLAAYLYLLSFMVMDKVSPDIIMSHTSAESTVPWYLYPMRLGIIGLLGSASILSSLFKRYEKQVYVFGIIIVISLILGPFYSESRFTKYIMIGMIGFASLMIYKILDRRYGKNCVLNLAIIGIIVPASAISIFIFIGINSLILQSQDYIETLPRRHFPSLSELQLFETLRDLVNMSSEKEKYNVIGFSNQYDRYKDGFMEKVPSFVGLPYEKVRQNPLALNASTLDGLYRHLVHSDTRFIIIPKNNLQPQNNITEASRFAIDHFKRVYEDGNYFVLEVPDIKAPSSAPEIDAGIVFSQAEDLVSPSLSNGRLLTFSSNRINFTENQSQTGEKGNHTKGLIIFGSAGNETTSWSDPTDPENKINSIEARFRIFPQDRNEDDNSGVGLKFQQRDKEYFTKLTNYGLELYQKSIGDKNNTLLSKNAQVEKKDLKWYSLRIENLYNSVNVYLNNILMIHVAKNISTENHDVISKIGLSSYDEIVEFSPVRVGNILESSYKSHSKAKSYSYDYPLSILALSNARYDIFKDNDASVFSNKIVFVSDNLNLDNSTYNRYLDFSRKGGTLIVINPNTNYSSMFSRLFSFHATDTKAEAFSKLTGDSNQDVPISVPGLVKRLEVKSSPDVKIIASYKNNKNQTIAPFALEKIFSKGGKIILINAEGYFNTISDLPTQYFNSLSNISNLIGLNFNAKTTSNNTAIPMKGFIGDMEVSGKIVLNTSSISLLDNSSPDSFTAKHVRIFDKTANSTTEYDDVSIKNFKLDGNSETLITTIGNLNLPKMNSQHNYFSTTIPDDFNMTVILYPKGKVQMSIVAQNDSVIDNIQSDSHLKIDFYGIRAPPLKSIPALLKNPEMTVNGNASIKNAYLDGYLRTSGELSRGVPLNFDGTLKAKFDFNDNYYETHGGIAITKYITYLQSLSMIGNEYQGQAQTYLKIPGDIPSDAIGQDLQLTKILTSWNSIFALIIASLVTIFGIKLIQRFGN